VASAAKWPREPGPRARYSPARLLRRRLPLIIVAVAAFLAVSGLLARWLSTESTERDKVHRLLEAEARGDAQAMLAQLHGCGDPACRATVLRSARTLKRRGAVKIVNYDSGTSYALGAATGRTRVAWTSLKQGLVVVQCVTVHRGGSALAGRSVTLLRISAPIDRQGSC
jgi:hypothetical protein